MPPALCMGGSDPPGSSPNPWVPSWPRDVAVAPWPRAAQCWLARWDRPGKPGRTPPAHGFRHHQSLKSPIPKTWRSLAKSYGVWSPCDGHGQCPKQGLVSSWGGERHRAPALPKPTGRVWMRSEVTQRDDVSGMMSQGLHPLEESKHTLRKWRRCREESGKGLDAWNFS